MARILIGAKSPEVCDRIKEALGSNPVYEYVEARHPDAFVDCLSESFDVIVFAPSIVRQEMKRAIGLLGDKVVIAVMVTDNSVFGSEVAGAGIWSVVSTQHPIDLRNAVEDILRRDS